MILLLSVIRDPKLSYCEKKIMIEAELRKCLMINNKMMQITFLLIDCSIQPEK